MKQLGMGAAGLTAAGTLFAPYAGAENKSAPPNILFIFSDQQRWDTLGCFGENMGRALGLSPNLDAMASEGVCFSHAFTAQPVCGPTRASSIARNPLTFRHSSRNVPLNDSIIALSTGFPGYEKSITTPFS